MTVKSTVRSAVRSAIRGTVRSGGALLPEWTHIYEGLTTFAELYNPWQPSGNNWEVEVEGYFSEPKTSNNTLLSMGSSVDTSNYLWSFRSTGVGFITRVAGVNASDINTPITDGPSYWVESFSSNDINPAFEMYDRTSIGALVRASVDGQFHKGQIHRIKLLDNYDTGRTEYPVNGRDVVELDGLTQYGEIPYTDQSKVPITFQFLLRTTGTQQFIIELSPVATSGDPRFYLSATGFISYSKMTNLTIDDAPVAPNVFSPEVGKVYTVSAVLDGWDNPPDSIRIGISQFNGGSSFVSGWVANLRVNNRYYPLDRADIIQDVNGDGSTDGNWINNPPQVHRLNNSIDINTVKRSKDAPSVSDNKLVNSLNGQEVGSITNLTGYELVNRGE